MFKIKENRIAAVRLGRLFDQFPSTPQKKSKKITPDKETGKVFGLEKLESLEWLPRGYLSNSQVEMYLRCGKQYEFRYIDGLKIPPGVALVEGICHHDVTGMDTDLMFTKGKNIPKKELIECFKDNFSDKSKKIPKKDWGDNHITEKGIYERGELMLTNYAKNIAPGIRPSAKSEGKIEIMVGEIPIIGFIDLEEEKNIIDYKVVKAVKSQNDVDTDLQLTIYSHARNKEGVAFCCFTKTKTGAVRMVPSIRTSNDFAAASAVINSVGKAIKAGVFPMCHPSNIFPCSEKWCGYFRQCRGKLLRGR